MGSDVSHDICRMYGVEHPDAFVGFRASFVIDEEGVVQKQDVHNLPFGRNIKELIRFLDAVDYNKAHGQVCPVNWEKGEEGMDANAGGVDNYFSKVAEAG